MIIQHNLPAMNSYRNSVANQKELNKNLERLTSGFKINRAGDNAAGLAISESMRSQINGLNQAATNANDAIGLIHTAEGALTEVHSMLQRMTTLATQAANGTYNETARGNIKSEMDELINEIDRIANNTDFNGIKPLAEDAGGTEIVMQFQIGPTNTETLTLSGAIMTTSGIFGPDFQTVLDVSGSSVDKANTAIGKIKEGIDNVSEFRARLGAAENRLEHSINNLKVTSENITAAESRIRDSDMAEEITAYTKNNILLQAAQSMLTQANAAPQSVLRMLG